jgi:ABC-2 type transport system permease protein
MRRRLSNVYWLMLKELQSFLYDFVLLGFVIYSFTVAIYAQAHATSEELHAAVGIVDEDHSQLSRAIAADFLPPYFKPAESVAPADVDRVLDLARYTFLIDIPPHFERDVLAGRRPALQLNIDATVAMQAGIGAGYIQQIVATEIGRRVGRSDTVAADPVNLAVRVSYNPNVATGWFNSIMGIVTNVTMLAIILAGAAIVREREHGTMDHLLIMPLSPFEIALAKVLSNGLVITVAVGFSLTVIVRILLGIPIIGSIPLFIAGVMIYLFFATAIGVFLGTVARSMPQLGLLFMLVALPMNMLSGANTPIESMPPVLQAIMQFSPSTHFVTFAQSILFRGAGLAIVWPDFIAVAVVGGFFFALALLRFRKVTAVVMG